MHFHYEGAEYIEYLCVFWPSVIFLFVILWFFFINTFFYRLTEIS